MKTQTSMTRFTKSGYKVFRCGYCDLQYIFRGIEPDYYNTGVYGWNCDIYLFDRLVITTGYRNMRGRPIPEQLIEKYSAIAKEIVTSGRFRCVQDEIVANAVNFIAELRKL